MTERPKPYVITLSEQEIFDKVATHLLTQKTKSVKDGTCMYRGPDGCQCAAGCLIPDDIYDYDKFEPKTWSSLVGLKLISCDTGEKNSFVRRLQKIHDMSSVDIWKSELQKLASIYNLDDSVLDTFEEAE